MNFNRLPAYALVLLALSASARGYAAEPPIPIEYAAEYREGFAAVQAKDWNRAYTVFRGLWAKTHTYDVAINLGQAEYMLKLYRDAAEHLAFGIFEAPPSDPKSAEGARRGLAAAKKYVATLMINVPNGTDVTVNGVKIGTAPLPAEVFVDPGQVVIKGKHPTLGKGEFDISPLAGEVKEVKMTLYPDESVPPPKTLPFVSSQLDDTSPKQPVNEPPKDTFRSKPNPWILVAGGAVTVGSLVTGVVLRVKANDSLTDARDKQKEQDSTYCSVPTNQAGSYCRTLYSDFKDGDRLKNYSTVAFVVAGVAAAGTATYLLWPRKARTTARSLRLEPSLTPAASGIWVSGNF